MSKKLTPEDFKNAGYSAADAKRLANDPATNWRAARGGDRRKLHPDQVLESSKITGSMLGVISFSRKKP